MPRRGLMALVLAVVAMHAAVLWLMLVASQPHVGRIGTAKRIAMEVVQIAPVLKAEPPAAPTAASRAAPTPVAPRAPARRTPLATRSDAITASPNAPAAPVDPAAPTQAAGPSPAPLILNSEATRRALRDVARQRSFADRANQDISAPAGSAFESRLGASVAGAARGDCMKGQFKGNNMGLLSLPALALAAASGECAR
ncbi:hypothetical protein [Variovorax sp. GB1P17]|uniref:hypothetical protein n=1 Tax=Variovorax sp. GB1P17 TaxID=3443740 RepID=UPI003F472111